MSPLAAAILLALHEEAQGDGMSLPRLGKRLGQGASVLLHELALMGDAVVGGVPGPGWVQLTQADGRWRVQLAFGGRTQVDLLLKE